jgi:hypothetical protein
MIAQYDHAELPDGNRTGPVQSVIDAGRISWIEFLGITNKTT